MTTRTLAQSANYLVTSVYETTHLHGEEVDHVVIGDFYGDPKCALLDHRERFCMIGGEGLIVYAIQPPFESYRRSTRSDQWREYGRGDPANVTWVIHLDQIDDDHFRMWVDPHGENEGQYLLDVRTLELRFAWEWGEGRSRDY